MNSRLYSRGFIYLEYTCPIESHHADDARKNTLNMTYVYLATTHLPLCFELILKPHPEGRTQIDDM